MTVTRYVVVKPNGKIYSQYGSNLELYFKDRTQAEKVAISWGKVKEVKIEIPIE